MGRPAEVDGDAPTPDARYAFGGQADPTDALLAIKHGKIAKVN